jgi:hypothetical protein
MPKKAEMKSHRVSGMGGEWLRKITPGQEREAADKCEGKHGEGKEKVR